MSQVNRDITSKIFKNMLEAKNLYYFYLLEKFGTVEARNIRFQLMGLFMRSFAWPKDIYEPARGMQ